MPGNCPHYCRATARIMGVGLNTV
ncbi:IS1-like element transposase, partial [Escherichia coli]